MPASFGAIAQLGERYTGSVEVGGSIPPSSTRFTGNTENPESRGKVMHRAGRWAVLAGILLVTIGMVVGFTAMFQDADDIAITALGLIPLGFIALLAGTVATQLSKPADDESRPMDRKEPL